MLLGRTRFYINAADENLARIFRTLMYKNVGVVSIVVFLFLLMVFSTTFDRILREDAFNFVSKGLEIANGNFSLVREQSIGWPLVLGSAYYLLNNESLFGGMYIARWLSILCVSLSVIPIAYLCKKIVLNENSAGAVIVASIAFALTPLIHFSGRYGMSEALFMLLTVSSITPLIRDKIEIKHIVLAATLAGLAFYVKPVSLFFLVVMVLLLLTRGAGKTGYKQALTATIVFLVISSPHWLMRYDAFGTPLDFGANSKFLVDTYEDVWASNVLTPTWFEYVRTHQWHDYYYKFVDQGLLKIWQYFLKWTTLPFWIYLVMFSLFAYPFFPRYKHHKALLLVLLVSFAGLIPIFHIFGSRRHLIYLIPYVCVIGACFLASLDLKVRCKFSNVLLATILVVNISLVPLPPWFGLQFMGFPWVKDDWAIWVAQNLEGKVAIVDGGDLIRMSEHYAIDGIPKAFMDVNPKITPIRPGTFNTLDKALEDFEKQGIRYVITDQNHIKRRPYLKQIEDPRWHDTFSRIKNYAVGKKGSVLAHVNVYRINYSTDQYFPPEALVGGWRKNTSPDFVRFVGLVPDRVEKFGQYNLSRKNTFEKGSDYGLYKGALVIKDGWIVGEWYNRADAKDFFMYLASVGKTFAMMCFGILVKDGQAGAVPYAMTNNSKVYDPRWLPEGFPLSDQGKGEITFEHIFQHTSGITPQKIPSGKILEKGRYVWTDHDSWVVGKDDLWPQTSQLHFKPGRALEYEHRETWGTHSGAYSSVAFAHLGIVFRNIYDMPAHSFMETRLAGPLGISRVDYHEPTSEDLKWFTAGGLRLTTRDFARFAYFVLRSGSWKGQQLVPEEWMRSLVSKPYYDNLRSNVDGYFGEQYPKDMVRIYGSGANFAFIIPSQDLIVIRTGRVSNFYMELIQQDFLERAFRMLE